MFSKNNKNSGYKTFEPLSSKENGSKVRRTFEGRDSRRAAIADLGATLTPETKIDKRQTKVSAESNEVRGEKIIAKEENPTKPAADGETRKKRTKQQKASENDYRLLGRGRWLARHGHTLTYAGIFLFTLTLYFRPYELIPALSGFSSMALIIAIATLFIYLPTQLSVEGSPTVFTTEIKCILFLAVWAILTIPLAKDSAMAWAEFYDNFIKVVLIFIIMVNTLRTELRIKGLMWLGIGVGIMLSYQALDLYQQGIFKTDGYRVSVEFGGMFGNPNDLATHLVIFTPIAVALGAASKNKFAKIAYFAAAAMMVAANFVTQSRGAFLGLVAVAAVLILKFGRRQRIKAVLISSFVGLLVMVLAPGNYGIRVLSIFIPGLDPNGSSTQRTDLLMRSIWVTLRNPLGIGIGNSPIFGFHNLGTHNAFTQVSTELGVVAFAAYMILLISPLRKLAAIERQLFARSDYSWIYCLSIGIQASIAGFMVASFFSSVAYQWYVYYPIAYAIGLRRIYQLGQAENEIPITMEITPKNYLKPQRA